MDPQESIVDPVRAPPPPPMVDEPTPEPIKDFTPIIDAYRAAVLAADDVDALDTAWSNHISPIENELPKALYEECASIDDARRGFLDLQ
jgi:hypothetical protein